MSDAPNPPVFYPGSDADTVKALRNLTLRLMGYDPYMDPKFAEKYVAFLVGGDTTDHNDHADVIMKNGLRLEVKFSSASRKHNKAYFCWKRLRGYANKKDGEVDFLVLCGYWHGWHFWVVPYDKVQGTGKTVHVCMERDNNNAWVWLGRYYFGNEDGLRGRFISGV
jgi:hypothetical protein